MIRPATATPARSIRAALLGATLVVALLPAAAAAATVPQPLTDGAAEAAPTASTITLVKLVDVPTPVLAVSPRDGTDRIFIVSKGGRIRIVQDGALLSTPFLDLSAAVSTGGERGLLGLAFHPKFKTNRKLYVNYTNLSGNTVVNEYRASASNPNVVQRGSGRTILRVNQPYANHNGGMLAFGRGGYLFIGMGDGGGAGDPGRRAQNVDRLLGKLLRIDVNGSTATRNYRIPASNPYVGKRGRDEIWQRGLRNPWRFSFDRANGDLWIGDVGQARYEEVDRARRTASGPGKGVNWGWPVLEGRHCYRPAAGCSTAGKRLPIAEFTHANGRCSVTGGYVYRGSAIPALRGWYVYGDFCSGEVWAVSSGSASPARPVLLLGPGSGRLISGFGETEAGELLLCDLGGAVYRIVAG